MNAWFAIGTAAVVFAGGFGLGDRLKQGAWDAQRASQAEIDREAQRSRDHDTIRQVDAYAHALKAEQGVTAAVARDAERVRNEAERLAIRARANATEPQAGTVASLAELLGEGAGLLEEGRRYLGECRAAREALTGRAVDGDRGRMDR